MTLKTNGFRAISNSSPDSPEGDLEGVRTHLDSENRCCSHNLEFIAGFAGGWFWGAGLTLTVKTNGFRIIWNSSLDSPEGDFFGGGGSRLTLTVKTHGLCIIWNSSPDSPEGDWRAGRVKAHFDCETNGFRTIWNSSPDSLEGDLGGQGSHSGFFPKHALA